MDAERLARAGIDALARAGDARAVLAEVWQAFHLTEAVAAMLASTSGGGARGTPVPPHAEAAAHPEAAVHPAGAAVGSIDPDPPTAVADRLLRAARDAAAVFGPDAPPGARAVRAARLTGLADPPRTVELLRRLAQESAVAMMAISCAAEEEEQYWQCVDGVDAAHELTRRLNELLDTLTYASLATEGAAGSVASGPRAPRPGGVRQDGSHD
ncbi:DUF6099 family protein [Allostreptomyces psammosilenae]|uniref:Uncharacterized protein n=1 Tax=Allostreptomyces psammosilenae TaxID=1892865 RepID=A0A852ZQM6_9ACTN|nr:DUF6099 family protein [Allostreptomyces psammosilenae]NYI03164.1 hypothetical protein [Allostreptomyces psammosilenae]